MAATTELSFFQSLAIQFRVLHALMMRELITRYGRDNLGVLWLVGEPMIFTLGVTTLWSAAGLAHGGGLLIGADVAQCHLAMQRRHRTEQAALVPSRRAHHRCVFDAHCAGNHRRFQ